MNGAKFDCSRESRDAHENSGVPIRVPAVVFVHFQQQMETYWSGIIKKFGSRRLIRRRSARRRTYVESADLSE